MRPPVAPLALDYLAAALEVAGYRPELLDLTWAADTQQAIASYFRHHQPILVGFTLRNTDDCYLASRYSCLPYARQVVALLRGHTDAPIVVGGCGFSIMPVPLLVEIGADFGLAGEGEESLPRLVEALARGEDPRSLPGLVYRADGGVHCNPLQFAPLAELPLSPRAFLDNLRYWREGGQGGFETKRGCAGSCIYCADPVAKGRQVRLRNPRDVAQEIVNLAAQGVFHLHTCDAEFNLPPDHALAVCEELIVSGLAERVRWWAYCAPGPFDEQLAAKMKRAGCVGIDFGADHGCDEQLARLGRAHRVEDLERVAYLCHKHDLVFMFDLLLGAPGETRQTVRQTIELMQRLQPSRVGISAGVRVYPGTPLAAQVLGYPLGQQPGLVGELENNDSLTRPVFYIAPALGVDFSAYLAELITGDQRFFYPDPAAKGADYNYRENRVLVEAIAAGHRGAYWDILRRLQEGLLPGASSSCFRPPACSIL